MRKLTGFGENNMHAIDAQVSVLETDMSEDDIYAKFDEDHPEDCEWSEHTKVCALEAYQWLHGEVAEAPSEGWEPLCE